MSIANNNVDFSPQIVMIDIIICGLASVRWYGMLGADGGGRQGFKDQIYDVYRYLPPQIQVPAAARRHGWSQSSDGVAGRRRERWGLGEDKGLHWRGLRQIETWESEQARHPRAPADQ
jgi:hypothetical protein